MLPQIYVTTVLFLIIFIILSFISFLLLTVLLIPIIFLFLLSTPQPYPSIIHIYQPSIIHIYQPSIIHIYQSPIIHIYQSPIINIHHLIYFFLFKYFSNIQMITKFLHQFFIKPYFLFLLFNLLSKHCRSIQSIIHCIFYKTSYTLDQPIYPLYQPILLQTSFKLLLNAPILFPKKHFGVVLFQSITIVHLLHPFYIVHTIDHLAILLL